MEYYYIFPLLGTRKYIYVSPLLTSLHFFSHLLVFYKLFAFKTIVVVVVFWHPVLLQMGRNSTVCTGDTGWVVSQALSWLYTPIHCLIQAALAVCFSQESPALCWPAQTQPWYAVLPYPRNMHIFSQICILFVWPRFHPWNNSCASFIMLDVAGLPVPENMCHMCNLLQKGPLEVISLRRWKVRLRYQQKFNLSKHLKYEHCFDPQFCTFSCEGCSIYHSETFIQPVLYQGNLIYMTSDLELETCQAMISKTPNFRASQ